MIAFEGMHPTLKHAPPKRSRSTSATFAPTLAALRAVSSPAGPAPMTTKLYLSTGSGFCQSGRCNILVVPFDHSHSLTHMDDTRFLRIGRPI